MQWLGIGVAILITAGWIIYSRRKGIVTLSRDQAENALDSLRKYQGDNFRGRQDLIASLSQGKMTLTKDQAEMVLELVRKDLTEIERKRQAIIDESAAKGNTISL